MSIANRPPTRFSSLQGTRNKEKLFCILLSAVLSMLSLVHAVGCKSRTESTKAGSERKTVKTIDKTEFPDPGDVSPSEVLAIHSEGLPEARGVDDEKLKRKPHLKVVLESLYKVQTRYVDPAKIKPGKMFVQGLQEVQENVAAVQVRFFPQDSESPELGVVQVGKNILPFSLDGLKGIDDAYNYFRWVLGFIKSKLTETGDFSKEDEDDIEYAAINGFLSYLDPYSVILPPKSYDEMKIRTSGAFGGIGIVISIRKGALTVISPIDGTPASRAGLQPMDKIVQIEAESTVNMSLHEAVNRLRGEVGTDVTILIERDGLPAPKKHTLTRARIEIHSVTSRLLEGNVGYLRLSRFSENTLPELKENIRKMTNKGAHSMILDVTNNPGGLLSQAVAVADAFLDEGIIVTTEGAGGTRLETRNADKKTTLWRGPLVVLANRGSASAGEIVAGALKHLGRAVVFGDQTFGKGTVQVLMKNADGSALKLTVAEYLVRGDVPIQTAGIVPDILTLPITLKDKWVRFHSLQRETGEEHLPKHIITERKIEERVPGWSLRYLHKQTEKPATRTAEDGETGADQRLMHMARDFLVKHRGTREEMLKEAPRFVEREKQEWEKQIIRAFRKVGVDWSPGAGEKIDGSTLKAEISTDKPKNTVEANDEINITVTIENTGEKPIYRIRSVLKAAAYYLDEREFIMGRIDPGKKKSWSVKVNIPGHQRTQVQPLSINLFSDDEPIEDFEGPAEDSPFLLTIKGLKRPELRLVYKLEEKEGNDNGFLEGGETVKMKGTIENIGPGTANNAIVTLRNVSGKRVYLLKGREVFEKIEPGEKKPFELSFRLQKEGFKKELNMELGAYEPDVRIGFDQELSFDLEKPVTELRGNLQAPSIHLEPVEHLTDSSYMELSGKVTHPERIIDAYVFIGNDKNLSYRKKVYYRAAETPDTNEMIIDTRMNLPEGLNSIVVVARSSRKLTSYHLLMVLRRGGKEEADSSKILSPTPASQETDPEGAVKDLTR